MAFPPNYNQERKAREAAKQRKAREKQERREDKSAARKQDNEPGFTAEPKKDI